MSAYFQNIFSQLFLHISLTSAGCSLHGSMHQLYSSLSQKQTFILYCLYEEQTVLIYERKRTYFFIIKVFLLVYKYLVCLALIYIIFLTQLFFYKKVIDLACFINLIIKMYSFSKQSKNNNSSYYFVRAHQINQTNYSSAKTIDPFKATPYAKKSGFNFTFSRDFYANKNISSAHQPNAKSYKYRSSSLPSENFVNELKNPNFYFYDQLKNRDYIRMKNYRSASYLPYQSALTYRRLHEGVQMEPPRLKFDQNGFNSKNYSKTSIYSAGLNRFARFNQNAKIPRYVHTQSNKPFISTQVKLYDKSNHQTQYTHIDSEFHMAKVSSQVSLKKKTQIKNHPNHPPVINCSIQVKSDDQGRYYSTVESNFPNLITSQKCLYDQKNKIMTTTATIVRESDSYQNQDKIKKVRKSINQPPKYDTYILHKKQSIQKSISPISISKSIKKNQRICSVKKQATPSSERKRSKKSPTKKKNQIEYQLGQYQNVKSPQRKIAKQKQGKTTTRQPSATQADMKYYYSKYFIESLDKKYMHKCRQSSLNINEQDKRSERSKNEKTKVQQPTPKKMAVIRSPRKKNTKQTELKSNSQNYASTHLLTVKK